MKSPLTQQTKVKKTDVLNKNYCTGCGFKRNCDIKNLCYTTKKKACPFIEKIELNAQNKWNIGSCEFETLTNILKNDNRYRMFTLPELIDFTFDPKSNDEAAAKALGSLLSVQKSCIGTNDLTEDVWEFYIPIPPLKNYKRVSPFWFSWGQE